MASLFSGSMGKRTAEGVRRWRPWLPGRTAHPEAGLTLLECLVAIVVLSIVGVAVTPPLFLATAARVQTNRAEQANQLAQGEIDRVRVAVELGRYSPDEIPKPGGEPVQSTSVPSTILPKSRLSSTYVGANPACDTTTKSFEFPEIEELVPFDVNGDCTADFLVQIFRNSVNAGAEVETVDSEGNEVTVPIAFSMGVRVWTYPGNTEDGTALKTALSSEPASLQVGNAIGSQSNRPLAVIYTQLARPDTRSSYEKYCRSLGGSEAACVPNASPTPSP